MKNFKSCLKIKCGTTCTYNIKNEFKIKWQKLEEASFKSFCTLINGYENTNVEEEPDNKSAIIFFNGSNINKGHLEEH